MTILFARNRDALRQRLVIASGLLAFAGASNAATITWSSAAFVHGGTNGNVMGAGSDANYADGSVDSFAFSGSLIGAVNLGGAAQTYTSTAGASIAFAAGTALSASGTIAYDFTGGATVTNAHANNTGNTNISKTALTSTTAETITLNGLVSGQDYRIQLFVMDGIDIAGRQTNFALIDGFQAGEYTNGITGVTWGNGLLVTGLFTANGASQNFTIQSFNSGAYSTSIGAQLNAVTLYAVPEPSTGGLLGVGALAGVAIARRRRRA